MDANPLAPFVVRPCFGRVNPEDALAEGFGVFDTQDDGYGWFPTREAAEAVAAGLNAA